jgi:A/G-specific adenine glycosylase
LILRDADRRVLLLARPPSGIWGGLISLPELSDDQDATRYAEDVLGCQVENLREMPPLHHSFTHFRLTLRPLLADVQVLGQARESADQRWLTASQCPGAPLPAPIRKLLQAAFAATP